jgi:IS5 family transposase
VDATLIAAPSSTKNKDKKRDPEMHSSQKGNEWHFGMKAHSAWMRTQGWCTPSSAPRATCLMWWRATVCSMVRRQTSLGMRATKAHTSAPMPEGRHLACGDAPGQTQRAGQGEQPIDALIDQVEKIKASIRAKVEHPSG